jgi:flagellar biosynthesis protein FlhB
MLWMLGPWLLSICVAACAIQWIQFGWLWVPQKLTPDLQRITPGRNLPRLFEPAQLLRTVFLMFKLVGVLAFAGWLFWKNLPLVAALGSLKTEEILPVAGALLIRITLWISVGLLLLGGIDYAWQRGKYERALCMTPDDWRDEIKSVHNEVSSLRRRHARQQPEDAD